MDRPPRRLLRVGLTGGIATGKSHVLRGLAAAGLATVDLDRVAHAVIAPDGEGHAPVLAAFGPAVLGADGAIDRGALGAIVFARPEERARLDAIVHPLVRVREAEIAREAEAAGTRYLVTDAALLVETGSHLRFDRLVVTWCPRAVQLARLRARDGLGAAAASARLAAQMPSDEKRAYADFVVDTSGAPADTEAQVAALALRLRGLEPPPPLALTAARAAACLDDGPRRGPRGLDPHRLAEACADGGLDLARLARILEPPAPGPWYRAARDGDGEPGPHVLAGALAVCCAARGVDMPYVLGAAVSLARLTHREPAAAAGAGLAALAAWDVAARGGLGGLHEGALAAWSADARRRTGGEVPEVVASEVRRAADGGAAGSLSGALAGLAAGGALPTSMSAGLVARLLAGPPPD